MLQFKPLPDQSTVDKTTEEWLGEIERKLDYKRWYCGHFCAAKSIDRISSEACELDCLLID